MASWVRFNDTSNRWELSTNQGSNWGELPLGIRLIDGSAGVPPLAFDQDPDTGLYRPGTNQLGIVTAGTHHWSFDASGHFVPQIDVTYDIASNTQAIREICARKFTGICLASFAFSSGQGNAGGGGDTQLTSYNVTIPANLASQPGDTFIIEGTFTHVGAGTSNPRTAKIQVDSDTIRTIFTTAVNLANMITNFRILLRRRTSTTGAWTGVSFIDWSSAAPGGAQPYPMNYGMSGDFTVAQTLKIFAAGTTANDLKLADYNVFFFPTLVGVTV